MYWNSQQAGGYGIEQGTENQRASKTRQNKLKKKHEVEKVADMWGEKEMTNARGNKNCHKQVLP